MEKQLLEQWQLQVNQEPLYKEILNQYLQLSDKPIEDGYIDYTGDVFFLKGKKKDMYFFNSTRVDIPECSLGFYMKGFCSNGVGYDCALLFLVDRNARDFGIVERDVLGYYEEVLMGGEVSGWEWVALDGYDDYFGVVLQWRKTCNVRAVKGMKGNSFRNVGARVVSLIEVVVEMHEKGIYDLFISEITLDSLLVYRYTPFVGLYNCGMWDYGGNYGDFVAPDLQRSPLCDVYSIGVLIISIFCHKIISPEDATENDFKPTLWTLKPQVETIDDIIEFTRRCCSSQDERPSMVEVLSIFRSLMIDAIVHEEECRNFWKHYFPNSMKISNSLFMNAFKEYFNPTIDEHFQMKQTAFLKLLNYKGKRVLIEEFSRCLYWFGPIRSVNETSFEQCSIEDLCTEFPFLARIENQLAKHAFHGQVTFEEANKKLRKKNKSGKHKYYLLRFSGTIPGCYAISRSKRGKILHYRFYHKQGTAYYLNENHTGKSYASIDEITASYVSGYAPLEEGEFSPIYDAYQVTSSGYTRSGYYCSDYF